MAQNTSPIYSLTPVVSAGQIPSTINANTKSDGTGTIGTDMVKCFTANASNGSYVSKMRIFAGATGATTMTATVLRVYVSTKTSGATTNADTFLYQEVTVAGLSVDNASTALQYYEVPFNVALPASETILVSVNAASAAGTLWQCTVFGGDY